MTPFGRVSAPPVLALVLAAAVATGEEKAMDAGLELVSGPPEQCVRLNRIERTEILDEHNILFHMRDDRTYRNYMSEGCAGLDRGDAFMYRTSIGQLCNVDIITLLNDIGFGFIPGASCGLGRFYPVSEEQESELRRRLVSR